MVALSQSSLGGRPHRVVYCAPPPSDRRSWAFAAAAAPLAVVLVAAGYVRRLEV